MIIIGMYLGLQPGFELIQVSRRCDWRLFMVALGNAKLLPEQKADAS